MTDAMTTAPRTEPEPPGPPTAMRPVELMRWGWRQLTSMRTALALLFLLALGAVPGSLVPQTGVDPVQVAQFKADHPALTPIYERLSLFSVYSAPWFAAIYLLLFVSLVGCVLPRSRQHWSQMRARPPRAPRNLTRLPAHTEWDTERPADVVLDAAEQELRRRRYRVDRTDDAVSAERGFLRETGNLVFHVSLIGLLVGVAVGNLLGYKGSVLVVEGDGFSNTLSRYDSFSHGASFDEAGLTPFTVSLDRLRVRYQVEGDQRGAPRDFRATVSYTSEPGAPPREFDLRVNHPLVIEGTKVFLIGNGYAPVFTVRDSTGDEVFSGPVPFLPRDGNNTSDGVIKVPGARPQQLGFEGMFLPTAVIDKDLGPISDYPDAVIPRAVLNAWAGDLGDASGVPQSVYKLEKKNMKQIKENGKPLAKILAPGQEMALPGGQGSVRFDGVRRYATLQVAHDPGKGFALLASGLALGGLMLSLFVKRRRVWVRATPVPGRRTLVEVAGLARTEGEDRDGLTDEVAQVTSALGHEGAVRSRRDEED
ncbi:MAG: cytochrome c biosis protein [Actinomycetota bacterium]|nr:cytochrome c biosis protein [Actinomycetota bacterium]